MVSPIEEDFSIQSIQINGSHVAEPEGCNVGSLTNCPMDIDG